MAQLIGAPGAKVQIVGGVYRGRRGVTVSEPDGTQSVRVLMDCRSAYDAGRPREWAWIPLEYLEMGN